jgi:hypothetical protein
MHHVLYIIVATFMLCASIVIITMPPIAPKTSWLQFAAVVMAIFAYVAVLMSLPA